MNKTQFFNDQARLPAVNQTAERFQTIESNQILMAKHIDELASKIEPVEKRVNLYMSITIVMTFLSLALASVVIFSHLN